MFVNYYNTNQNYYNDSINHCVYYVYYVTNTHNSQYVSFMHVLCIIHFVCTLCSFGMNNNKAL